MSLDCLPNQLPNERVVLFLRRHWSAWAIIIASFLLLTGVPLIAGFMFQDRVNTWFTHPIGGPVATILISAYFLGVWLLAFLEFTDYYLDVWIVTNERVINIEQNGLFNRTVSEMHLINIQDVTSEVSGMFRTFFDFGNVHIQTAAEKLRFDFKDVPSPELVKEHILRLVDDDKGRHGDGVHNEADRPRSTHA